MLFFLIPFLGFAQYSVKGRINSDLDYSWILLYKIQNGNQTYVNNADVVEGAFEFELGENEPSGVYRAYYQIENNLYVEFIYNKEEVSFNFDPSDPGGTISFESSEENTVYQNYYKEISSRQKKLDSLQVMHFKSDDKRFDAELEAAYDLELEKLRETQSRFERASEGMLTHHFIVASAQHNAEDLIKDGQEYLKEAKAHFFDAIDIKDPVLRNSSFIQDRLLDFVFYLNQADNPEARNALHQEAIEQCVQWIGEETEVLQQFETSLLENYVTEENVPMIYFVIENYYNQLPVEYQDDALKRKVMATLKTAIGNTAPDFEWTREGVSQSLHGLNGHDYYVVVFFSSGCPHCRVEIPEFHEFIRGIENIQVVTIGLEDQEKDWAEMTGDYQEFINVLDLDKWNSAKARDYGVKAIPSYFVLDNEKRILAKPEDLKELQSLFEAQ